MIEERWSSMLKGDCVWVTYFQDRSLYKYTRVARSQDGVEVKSIIDLVLVKKDMLRYMQNVRAVRGMGRGFSDHHVVLCKVMLVRTWIKRRDGIVSTMRIRSEKMREHQYREGYVRGNE